MNAAEIINAGVVAAATGELYASFLLSFTFYLAKSERNGRVVFMNSNELPECDICASLHATAECSDTMCGKCDHVIDNCECNAPMMMSAAEWVAFRATYTVKVVNHGGSTLPYRAVAKRGNAVIGWTGACKTERAAEAAGWRIAHVTQAK